MQFYFLIIFMGYLDWNLTTTYRYIPKVRGGKGEKQGRKETWGKTRSPHTHTQRGLTLLLATRCHSGDSVRKGDVVGARNAHGADVCDP